MSASPQVFAKIVVGLDGSDTALNALRWASSRVPASGLHVVHAGAPDPVIPADIEVASVHSRDLAPSRAMLTAACDLGADAIIVGPHGSGLGRGLGSVARDLLATARLPVLIIDGAEAPRSLAGPVVACVGYGEPADAAATWAAAYADLRGVPLVLLHAVAYRPIFPRDSVSEVVASYLGPGVAAEWARDELTALADQLHQTYPDLSISTHIEGSSVIKAVTRAGENAELVVLGKRSEEEFLHVIGTPRLRRLVARSRFPTAVIPTAADR